MNVHTKSPAKAPPGNAAAPRVNYFAQSPELARKLTELILTAKQGAIEESIIDLVAIRTAQINGCSFCLDMHVKRPGSMANASSGSTTSLPGGSRPCSLRASARR